MTQSPDHSALFWVCAQEPITRSDRIQSFGFLLGMSSDWVVVRASQILKAVLGIAADAATGRRLDDIVDRPTLHDIRNRMLALYLTNSTERLFGVGLIEIGQSRGTSLSVAEYAAAITGRVEAPARAHDRMNRANWSPALLSSLLDDQVAAYASKNKDRIRIVGAPACLTPKAYSTMALVIHELVTNSCKYGFRDARYQPGHRDQPCARRTARRAGNSLYATKPFDRDLIRASIAQTLGTRA